MTVLDTPEERQTVFPVSVEFYHEAGRLGLIGEDVELLEGVIFKKMPKSPLHQTLIRILQKMLQEIVPHSCFIDRECPITCRDSEPEPDLVVFQGDLSDYQVRHPTTAELVIEISINTRQRDRSKAAIYAEAGVKEYWLVEPEVGTITRYTEPTSSGYKEMHTFPATDSVASTVLSDFRVTLADLMK